MGHSLTACKAALPATPQHLQNPKWTPGGPKMADGSGKVSTPGMRKKDKGEKKKGRKEKIS